MAACAALCIGLLPQMAGLSSGGGGGTDAAPAGASESLAASSTPAAGAYAAGGESSPSTEVRSSNAGRPEAEDTAPAAGMTGSRLNLKNAAGAICMRIFGLTGSGKKKDPLKALKTQNSRLAAMNKGLKAQVAKLKAAQDQQASITEQLVEKQVTASLAALNIPASELPSATETEMTAPAQPVALPASREEFMALSVADRLAVTSAHPEAVKKWL